MNQAAILSHKTKGLNKNKTQDIKGQKPESKDENLNESNAQLNENFDASMDESQFKDNNDSRIKLNSQTPSHEHNLQNATFFRYYILVGGRWDVLLG